uniref:Uncharacterized protein n=1 Tax=mine drainage metagenome TaxID=410659 RepID=E6QN44_9ZZZZ
MKKMLGLAIATLFCTFFVGCCSLGIDCPSSQPTGWIQAKTTIGGVLQPWTGATVQADALPDTPNGYACTPLSPGCTLSMSGPTDTNGYFPINSNAVPGDWQIAIQGDSECEGGAASPDLYITPTSKGLAQVVPCGSTASGSATANPATCTQTVNNSNGQITTNCPATITLTVDSPVLSTSHALDVSDYNNTGNQEYSFSGNASSTTTIVVPTPKFVGESVLVIYDPQTNQPVGAALFTLTQTIYNPCGTERSC